MSRLVYFPWKLPFPDFVPDDSHSIGLSLSDCPNFSVSSALVYPATIDSNGSTFGFEIDTNEVMINLKSGLKLEDVLPV